MDIFFFGGCGGLSLFFCSIAKSQLIFFSSWFTLPLYGPVLLLISDAGWTWRYGPKNVFFGRSQPCFYIPCRRITTPDTVFPTRKATNRSARSRPIGCLGFAPGLLGCEDGQGRRMWCRGVLALKIPWKPDVGPVFLAFDSRPIFWFAGSSG